MGELSRTKTVEMSDLSYRYPKRMKLIIRDNDDAVGEWAARYVKKRILDFKPSADRYFVLGLPTGSTPIKMYRKLVEYNKAGELSFKYVKTFNMDEYVGLPREHKESYHYFMFEHIFKVSCIIRYVIFQSTIRWKLDSAEKAVY